MFLPFRKIIIVFFVLLQFIAPLVHGHTGEKIFDNSLHVPGLERYTRHYALKQQPTLHHQMSALCTLSEGLLVAVNMGIKAEQSDTINNLDSPPYIPSSAIIIKLLLSAFDANFSPHAQLASTHFFTSSFLARAPPL